jgi:RNA exonuclease 4
MEINMQHHVDHYVQEAQTIIRENIHLPDNEFCQLCLEYVGVNFDCLSTYRGDDKHRSPFIHLLVITNKFLTLSMIATILSVCEIREIIDEIRQTDGCTALHLASWRMNFRMVKLLMDLGADDTKLNNYGETAKECKTKIRDCCICKRHFKTFDSLVAHQNSTGHGSNILAIDCEFVGVIVPPKIVKQSNGLAHVAISDVWGNAVYQSWCIPNGQIIDYRTSVSGVRKKDICGAPSFDRVRDDVLSVIKGHTLLGHSIKYDLEALHLTHLNLPVIDTFDISKEMGHQAGCLSLQTLCIFYQIRNTSFQSGEHNPLDDARATMDLYEVLNRKPQTSSNKRKKRG